MAFPQRLVMSPLMCKNCDSTQNITTINFSRLFGLFCCDNKSCIKKIKEDLIKYINTEEKIPLYGVINKYNTINETKNNYMILFNFYRKSINSIYNGYINISDDLICIKNINFNNKKILGFVLNFDNNCRFVGLDNIMFHNKNFYSFLVNCKNLFNNEQIIISFDELSSKIKDNIKKYNIDNNTKKSSDFLV